MRRAERARRAADLKKIAADVVALYKEADAKLVSESASVSIKAAARALRQLESDGVVRRAGPRGYVAVEVSA